MAAGLGFKDFVTGEVLTAADVDGYLMQGVWVFASAAARDAAVTSPQEGNFAYLKDTNVTTYYTGSAWANLDTTGMTNPMTTTGDTIYSSSGSTPARLGIGSTGNVLTVSGGVPVWSAPAGGGSLTLLSTTTCSGTSTTVSSISQSYTNLYIVISGLTTSTGGLNPSWKTNITGSVYTYMKIGGSTVATTNLDALVDIYGDTIQGPSGQDANNIIILTIEQYASTTLRKLFNSAHGFTGSSNGRYDMMNGVIASNTNVDSFILSNYQNSSFSAGTIKIYGVN